VEEDDMDGIELGRRVVRLRAEGRARARFAMVWQNRPDATAATAADCVRSAKEPLGRFDALRRRPEQVPLAVHWPARPSAGPYAGER
jgi:hypothetical protein